MSMQCFRLSDNKNVPVNNLVLLLCFLTYIFHTLSCPSLVDPVQFHNIGNNNFVINRII